MAREAFQAPTQHPSPHTTPRLCADPHPTWTSAGPAQKSPCPPPTHARCIIWEQRDLSQLPGAGQGTVGPTVGDRSVQCQGQRRKEGVVSFSPPAHSLRPPERGEQAADTAQQPWQGEMGTPCSLTRPQPQAPGTVGPKGLLRAAGLRAPPLCVAAPVAGPPGAQDTES